MSQILFGYAAAWVVLFVGCVLAGIAIAGATLVLAVVIVLA